MNRLLAVTFAITLCGFGPPLAAAAATAPATIRAAQDFIDVRGNGFVERTSKKIFNPWGFNYDRNDEGGLLESYWDRKWAAVESDFREMKQLGANVVRIHLQFGKFMAARDQPDAHNFAQLERLVRLAEETGLYLDLTGLACYRKQDVPAWYDELDETKRWDAQARFWEEVARRCADRPGVFCYDLMNEPIIPGDKQPDKQWLYPLPFGGFYFVQFVTLDPAGRKRDEIAVAWIRRLTDAIRKHDARTPITVGLLPNSLDGPGLTSGFIPDRVAPALDFLCTHIYPVTGKLDEALATARGFATAGAGKPLVIEEIFPLTCDAPDVGRFIERSRPFTAGYVGFYWGKPIRELQSSDKNVDKQLLALLELFQKLNPNR